MPSCTPFLPKPLFAAQGFRWSIGTDSISAERPGVRQRTVRGGPISHLYRLDLLTFGVVSTCLGRVHTLAGYKTHPGPAFEIPTSLQAHL